MYEKPIKNTPFYKHIGKTDASSLKKQSRCVFCFESGDFQHTDKPTRFFLEPSRRINKIGFDGLDHLTRVVTSYLFL